MSSLLRVAVAATVVAVVVIAACGTLDTAPAPTAPPQATPTPQPAVTTETPQAVALVSAIVVAERQSDIPDYDRDDWKHWTDADGDCQNTRQEVLIEESTTSVTFTDDRMCRVESGAWTDPFTGTVTEDPSDLDIDHMVPLANAHDSGGHAWSDDRKERFANHLPFEGHLVATTASANRTKGRKGPEEWRPPDRGYWCRYAIDWIAVKREWGLTATQAEVDALRDMLDTCEHSAILQTTESSAAGPTPTATLTDPAPTPTSATELAAEAETDIADMDCTDFESWEDAQQFFESTGGPDADTHGLDRDGNGIACESLPGSPQAPAEATSTPTLELSPVATAQPTPAGLLYDPEGPDRNCTDFELWEDAQRFYEAAGGPDADPHRLDRDRNGFACESLPGGPG